MNLRVIAAAALLLLALPTMAQDAPLPELPPHSAPTAHVQVDALNNLTPSFDANAATQKYLAKVSGAAKAKSDAYFEGGYWLQLVDLVWNLIMAGALLWLRWSDGLRDWAEERTRSRWGQQLIYVAAYMMATTIASLPLAIYEGYFREHAYGLSTQTLAGWAGDFGINFAVSLVVMLIAVPILYFVIRKAREAWWQWGAGLALIFLVLQFALGPVFIAPLLNHYSPLPGSPLKARILSLARANEVPVDNVYLVDASRQSNRISANVSGFLGTSRLSLNDNLLHQGTPDEVLAVLGHEMGHYVLDHATRLILLLGLVYALGFAFANWGFVWLTEFFGGFWNLRRMDDIAGLPLLMALMAFYSFVTTPVTNTITRTTEQQADIFGVDAVRKPDAFATVILKLSSYRKLDPGKWEEILFYDHPSGHTRIQTMMTWKKEHVGDPDIRDTAGLP